MNHLGEETSIVNEPITFVERIEDINYIEEFISKGKDYAIYRLPKQSVCHFVGETMPTHTLRSLSELRDEKGFMIAPFALERTNDILIIRGSNVCFKLPYENNLPCASYTISEDRQKYYKDFDYFSSLLHDGTLEKVVLARNVYVEMEHSESELFRLFLKACRLYPRNFVTLWRTASSGTWLVATPELLLEQRAGTYKTMALAGTHSIHDLGVQVLSGWDNKNLSEQQLVSDYISGVLNKNGEIIKREGPYLSQSGELLHLRTDFDFQTDKSIGEILQDLHPTPAVCGFPKATAYDMIMSSESLDREYYAGFCGPLNLNNKSCLYVTLRCMKFVRGGAFAYAGGGLLRESAAPDEWAETCRKIETLLKILK